MDLPITLRRAAGAIVAIGALLLSLAVPAQAAGAKTGLHDTRQCIIVLEALKPGQTTSDIKTRTCSTDRNFADASRQAMQSTLLMTWYDEYYYGGASTQVRGDAGPCDSAGYGIAYVGASWNDRISSFRTFNGCRSVQGFDHANYGSVIYYCFQCDEHGSVYEPLMAAANNRVSSWWIWN